jgi:hypothetical protein
MDILDLLGNKSNTQTSAPPPVSSGGGDILDMLGGGKSSSPFSGQPSQHVYQDSSQPWYKRAWDFANTPITESLFGLPEDRPGAGGFERGVEHIVGGLTSPLSLALTAATFGGGGLLESAGATTLKEAGLSAEEIANATKASTAALQAIKDAKPIEPYINQALEAGGHDLSLLNRARAVVSPLNRDAELGSKEVQNLLSKSGLTRPQIKSLEAGELAPEERSVLASANGGFSDEELSKLADAGKTVAEAKKSFSPVEDAVRESGANVDQWKTAQDLLYKNGLTEADLLGGNAMERGAFHVIRSAVPDLPVAAALRASRTANTILNAGFTLQQFESAASMSPRFLDALKEGDYDHALEYGTEALAGAGLGVAGAGHALSSAGELFKPLLSTDKFRPNDEFLALDRTNREREAQHAVAEQHAIEVAKEARKILGHEPVRPILGDTPEVAAKKADELAMVIAQRQLGTNPELAKKYAAVLRAANGEDVKVPEGGPENGLPENLEEMIKDNKFKDKPQEYKDRVIRSYDAVGNGTVPENVVNAAKYLAEQEDRNYEIGSGNGLLTNYIDGHFHRTWENENPSGRVVAADSKSGRFTTRVSQAKQRVYDSTLTGLLKSPTQMKLDPVEITAQDRASLLKAAANKQLVHSLRDNFVRGSDGRPAVVLSGSGKVVAGANGEDPTTFIRPDQVNLITVAKPVIEHLQKTGDLERFLDEGSLRDITPRVYPQNIASSIEKLEDQAGKQEAKYDPEGNNILRKQIAALKDMQARGDYSGLKDFNSSLEKKYAWDPQDYITINNSAMRGWNFATNDSAGHSVLVNSDIRVHPEYAEYLKNRLGLAESDLARNPVGKALLGAGTKMKKTLLSLSPFHMVQEALRGIMVGVNPIGALKDAVHGDGPNILSGEKIDPSNPNSDTILKKCVEQGGTLGVDFKSLQEHSAGKSEGLSSDGGLLQKIPGVGKTIGNSMQFYENFLFQRYIPSLKARAMELMYHRYQEAHPDWSVDHVARAAASHTNDTFGGINWRQMGRSATTQDWGRLLLLAPDWLEAEMRSGARLFNKDEGGLGREQVAKMAMSMWGIARVLNLVGTGNAHYEAPFGLAVKNKEGKETVFSIRILPTDLLHAASDPVQFLTGRLNPTIRTGQELVSGRDQYGRKLSPQDLWVDVFRNMAPIPAQSIGQMVSGSGPEVGSPAQVWKAIGGTARTFQTPAGKMAADLAASHSEDGLVDPSQQARHRMIINLEDQVRAGEVSWPDVVKLTYNTGQLKESEMKRMQQNLQHTKGMDSTMASLYTRASRLPATEYLQLMEQMNPSEKTALLPLTQQVMKKYTSKAMKSMTPQERSQDPTLQRILNMMHPGGNQVSYAPPPTSPVIPEPVKNEVAYLYTATHPQTGHKVGSNNGTDWFDHQTGEPING